MRIGVLSDTHLSEPSSAFKKAVELYFKDVDVIFHAGDFVEWAVAEYLSSLKELIAVCGNMDPPAIREAFPRKQTIEFGGFRIGLIHGGGAPFGIESRIRDEFGEVDAIIYGHTHTPANHLNRGVFFFNPGSSAHSFWHGATLGILNIGEKIEGEIIKI